MKRAWFLVRRYWGIAGAILLLSSPLLYVLSTGPLFLLVRWPAQTGDYELSAQRYALLDQYVEPIRYGIEWLNHYNISNPYAWYLDFWKLPSLKDFGDNEVTVDMDYCSSPYDNLGKTTAHTDSSADVTKQVQAILGPDIPIEEAVLLPQYRRIYIKATAKSWKAIRSKCILLGPDNWFDLELHSRP